MPPVTPNPGHCPPAAHGKRVRVTLRNGTGFTGAAATTVWRQTGSAFDVLQWELAA